MDALQATHHPTLTELVYYQSEKVYEGHCSCGFYTGKCISEAERNFRLNAHAEKVK